MKAVILLQFILLITESLCGDGTGSKQKIRSTTQLWNDKNSLDKRWQEGEDQIVQWERANKVSFGNRQRYFGSIETQVSQPLK
jgi:hypothetical protein